MNRLINGSTQETIIKSKKLCEIIKLSEIIKIPQIIKSHIDFRMIDCLNTIFYKRIEKNYTNHYNELHILEFEMVF